MMAGARPGRGREARAADEHRDPREPGPQPEPGAAEASGHRAGSSRTAAPASAGRPTGCPRSRPRCAAFVLALLIGAVLIAFSSQAVLETLPYFFSYPWDFFSRAADRGRQVLLGAARRGSVGSEPAIGTTAGALGAADLRRTRRDARVPGRPVQHRCAGPAHPRCGCGARIRRLHLGPAAGHSPAGRPGRPASLGGALWGGIAGVLKARTGAHEVITTIMLNYLAAATADLLPRQGRIPAARAATTPISRRSTDSAHASRADRRLPARRARRVPAAVAWSGGCSNRSTLGFEMRAVGANPDASRTAGMSVPDGLHDGDGHRRWPRPASPATMQACSGTTTR